MYAKYIHLCDTKLFLRKDVIKCGKGWCNKNSLNWNARQRNKVNETEKDSSRSLRENLTILSIHLTCRICVRELVLAHFVARKREYIRDLSRSSRSRLATKLTGKSCSTLREKYA